MTNLPMAYDGFNRCRKCKTLATKDIDFTFAFQPIVDTRNHSVFAYEALVRGRQGESACSVLAQVDNTNKYSFDQKCRTRAIYMAAELDMTEHLSINFLPNAVYRPELCIRNTLAAAKSCHFPIERLIFEAVEGECLASNKHLVEVFQNYRDLGFRTAIDDFGAGYSGLCLLADFQPDFIKLDMDLIRGIHLDIVRQSIVHNVVNLCVDLGVKVIAEDVELAEERNFLDGCGIFMMQGYWFAKPELNLLTTIPTALWKT